RGRGITSHVRSISWTVRSGAILIGWRSGSASSLRTAPLPSTVHTDFTSAAASPRRFGSAASTPATSVAASRPGTLPADRVRRGRMPASLAQTRGAGTLDRSPRGRGRATGYGDPETAVVCRDRRQGNAGGVIGSSGVQCVGCRAENREGRRFCGECGLPLTTPCPFCAFSNEGNEKFCGGCGRALTAGSEPTKFVSPQAYTPQYLAERILGSRAAPGALA